MARASAALETSGAGSHLQHNVRFGESVPGALSHIEIDLPANRDVMCAVLRALSTLRLFVVQASAQRRGRRVKHAFQIRDVEGRTIDDARRRQLQCALLTLVAESCHPQEAAGRFSR